jgi:predicted GNAT family N-acyltransferase
MARRKLDKMALRRNEDWYGNNAAVNCFVCGKVFIVSGFLNKGRRDCPICHKTSAEIVNDTVTIEWPDEQEIPAVCSRAEMVNTKRLEEFVSLVESGGAIDSDSIEQQLPKAESIAFIDRSGKIVAAAAKKKPSAHYAESISCKSGYHLAHDTPEMGYVVVAKGCEGQRLSSKVIARILFEFGDGPVFATTSEQKIKRVLAKSGFNWVGHEWKSDRTGEMLSLWVRGII